MNFTQHHVGVEEDSSFAVVETETKAQILCADTGNGGETAFQLLRPCAVEHDYHELGYAATAHEARRKAEGLLASDVRYMQLVAAGYPICDGTYLIAICEDR